MANFPTTHWSEVTRAADGGADSARALEMLLTRYRPALCQVARELGLHEHDVDDLVQGFVHAKFLHRNLAAAAQQRRGRFRSLLRTALQNYFRDELRRAKRAPRNEPVEASIAASDQFEIEWAYALIADVESRMQADCETSGRQDLWQAYQVRFRQPSEGGAVPSLAETAHAIGHPGKTEKQISNVLVSVRRMFERHMRAAIGEYETSEAAIDQEIGELYQVLSQR